MKKAFRRALQVLVALQVLAALAGSARAQLATSFYTVTGIETRRLPNAVQLIIRTDGAVIFGGDQSEWIDFSNGGYAAKGTSQFRLRLLGARSRIAAFNNIGAYPVDSAQVTLGRDELQIPFFDADSSRQPQLDITLRFFVPVKVYRFQVQRYGSGANEVRIGGTFDALDFDVHIGDDRRSIVVTVISDRADADGAARISRVKPEEQKSELSVESSPEGSQTLSIRALHAPLPQVLEKLSEAAGVPIVTRPSVEQERVNLSASAPLASILQLLAHGLGLIVSPRAPLFGGGFEVGRDESLQTRRIALRNLSPERARLLLPDWLLPFLRADVENNALIASASPFVLDKIERDLQVLDRRRPSVRVQAEVYEVSRRDADAIALNLAFGQRGLPPAPGAPNPSYVPPAFELDGRGVAVVRLDQRRRGEGPSWRLALEALRIKGRANLRARPFVTVLSGETGTLFLGQSRFIPVLRSRGGQQDVQALNVPVGYSLRATPRVSESEPKSQEPTPISLSLSPRASTVDDVESGTGLPTLGIREVSTSARLNAGDALLIAGLDVDNLFSTRGRALSQRSAGEKTTLLVVVTAQVV